MKKTSGCGKVCALVAYVRLVLTITITLYNQKEQQKTATAFIYFFK